MLTCDQSRHSPAKSVNAVIMIEPHTADTSLSLRSCNPVPIRVASSTSTALARYSSAAWRSVGYDRTILAMHISRSTDSSPTGATFAALAVAT